MIDLHVHSVRSDGTMTPTELVDYAIEKGLSAMALTDHDTVDGLDEAIAYAESLRKSGIKNVPEIIPGIELSTDYDGKDIHIVGLYVNYKSKAFTDYLTEFIESRETRNRQMCALLKQDGFDISYEELLAEYPDAVITRAHFAGMLLKKGYVKSKREAFDRYIGDHKPYYIPREKVTPEMGIDLILKSDGIPVWAHPILAGFSNRTLEKLVAQFKEAGLIGIEAVYSTYTPSDERHIRELAQKYHLLLSGGSDFHGSNKDGIDLAVGLGHLYVDDHLLSEINQARKNILFTDMDGTLLNGSSLISSEMKLALNRLTASGHRLVLTSGRPLPSIIEMINTLGLDYPETYIISNNGALVYDYSNKKPLRTMRLSPETIREVFRLSDEAGIHAHAYTEDSVVGYEDDEELKFYRVRIHMPFIKTADPAGLLKDGSYKIQIIHLSDRGRLEALQKKILCKLGDCVDTVFSNDRYLEVIPKGVNKGEAVTFLSHYLSMPNSHTFAAGDEENDIPMLEAAGTGIAMANANDKVKKAADIITENSNAEDGLLEILNRYFI